MKTNSPTHDEISRRATEIWTAEGRPTDRDNEIWLSAEQQLLTSGRVAATRTRTPKDQPSSL